MSITPASDLKYWTDAVEPYKQRVCEVAKLMLKLEHAKFEKQAKGGDNAGGKLTKTIEEAVRQMKVDFPEKVMALGPDLEAVASLMFEVAAQLPVGYERDKGGNICAPGEDGPTPICGPLRVKAETRSLKDDRAGMIVEIKDNHCGWREVEYEQADLLSGDRSLAPFLDAGLKIKPRKKEAVRDLLHAAKSSKLIIMADQVGWASVDGKRVFVTPQKVYAPHDVAMRFENPKDYKIGQKGTLPDWQDSVGKYARDNSRLEFAACLAFAATLLEPLNIEGGGFHLSGDSSRGKTTTLQVGASGVGSGDEKTGYPQRLKASKMGPEAFGFRHNGVPFFGDETAQCADLYALTYDLANGQSSQRLDKDTNARERKSWHSLSLMTGEKPLAVKIKQEGKDMAPGQRVRFPDIPADMNCEHGVFDHLHGFDGGADLAKMLKQASCANYGTAFDAFMARLVNNLDGVIAARGRIDSISKSFVLKDVDGQVSRVADRFALVAFAGELAIEWGILPWPRDAAIKAARRMFDDWREARGDERYPQSVIDGAAKVLEAIRVHGASRFQTKDMEVVHNRIGFREDDSPTKPFSGGRGKQRFYVLKDAFDRLTDDNASAVAKYLEEQGKLEREQGDRHTVKVPYVLDRGRPVAYCVVVEFDPTREPERVGADEPELVG